MGTLDDLFRRFEHLNDIGASLSNERDLNRLLEKITLAAKAITRADGGTLYLLSEDKRHLHFEIVRTDSLNIAFGGTSGNPVSGKFPDLPLYRDDGSANDTMVAAFAAISGQTVNIADAYVAKGFDFSGTRDFDERTGYHSQSFLTVPMRNHEGEIIGVLQLINAHMPEHGVVVPFSEADQRLAESLASQAAIALTNRQLLHQLEVLFESFILLINSAIDDKSPYTGEHCQRVPELTMMLAEAAHETSVGPLADFRLTDRDRYELRLAALLHDCGKVTTPVHVVDKATKLQTIFDRIGLVDTRFELLRRDAEIRMLRQIVAGVPSERAEAEFREFVANMEVDRNFLHQANVGSERMSDDDIDRVRAIATGYRWQEASGVEVDFLSADELENLSIRAGTLTQQERQIINYHVTATIRMLEQLPWPKHLKNVPEYAGGHHERMDGKGYPRGLKREEMSWQARMIGIADIFEALTARDRPYKQGMTLSQALGILEKFRQNGHIDPDLHDVFISSEIYRKYAAEFLDAKQMDR
ncbi:MAG: HD domain-containing phosphohydrolase [Candidatus Dechloromonas phosphoritropha]